MKPRPAIAALEPYRPPQERAAALRLDFNENTRGCAPAVLRALGAATAETLATYPAVEPAEAAIAAAFGHSPATCLLTNGTDDAILLAAMTWLEAGAEAIVLRPSFALFRFYSAQMGAEVVELELPDRGGQFFTPVEQILAAATPRTRLIFLATPNNPTGHATPRAAVLALCQKLPETVVFADEAYADFLDDPRESLLGDVGPVPNLMVSRTFSKAHGLAGVRLGCLFAAPEAMAWLRRAHSPYNVNSLAAQCGRAAVQSPEWARASAVEARQAREIIEQALAEAGIPYWRSQANFVLFDAGARAAGLLAGMRERGILLRDRGRDRAGALRISCGTVGQTTLACEALREVWRGLA